MPVNDDHILKPKVAVDDDLQREELLAQRLGVKRVSKESKVRYDEWGDEI